ncbi:geranylgeranyl diphosphate synthase [Epichloe bromicola]|uniref:Geranylgeranyl diphosphate synthase n=1 Tax=Epichloe bromicola TaxID=79588 RepID=A0ABQ0CR68_9HYPO
MDNPLDQTTLATISLLELRLLRIEHVLHGQTVFHPAAQPDSAMQRLRNLERRFSMMASRIRVYGELLKIYISNPDLFRAPNASEPPSQLSMDAIQSIVLASASAFPAILSALTAIQDSPISDPSESASLISLTERMKAIETTQLAQSSEVAELRQRSEAVMLAWYELGILANSQSLADIESRAQGVERKVRRREVALEEEKQI